MDAPSLPSRPVSSRPHWTIPVSREETLTVREKFRAVTEEWNPPIPEYPFVERVRIADAFFGPDAESMDGERTLTRRIQVVGDLAALCKLSQPSRRGKPFNWNKEEKTANDAILQQEDEDIKTRKTSPPTSPIRPSADQCPFCFFEEGLSPEDRMR